MFHNFSLWKNLIRNKQWGAVASKSMIGLGLHGITKFPLMASMFMIAELFTDEEMDYLMYQGAEELDDLTNTPIGSILHRGMGSAVGLDTRDMLGEDSPLITDMYANSWGKTWHDKLIEIGLGAPYGFVKDVAVGSGALVDWTFDQLSDQTYYSEIEEKKIRQKMKKLFLYLLRMY